MQYLAPEVEEYGHVNGSRGGKGGVKSDINVTPLVDVMLVLLIIMMIIAPMLQKGVDVQAAHGRQHGGQA